LRRGYPWKTEFHAESILCFATFDLPFDFCASKPKLLKSI